MTTINTHPPSEDINNTFQQLRIENNSRFPNYVTQAYEGTHTYDVYAVTHTYTVEEHENRDTPRLSVYTQYTIDGEEVNCAEETWEIDEDGTMEYNGQTVEQFCCSNHHIDPQMDIETAMNHADEL